MARASGGCGRPTHTAVVPALMLDDLGQVAAPLWALDQLDPGLWQEGHLTEKKCQETLQEHPGVHQQKRPGQVPSDRRPGSQSSSRGAGRGQRERLKNRRGPAWTPHPPGLPTRLQIVARRPSGRGRGREGALQPVCAGSATSPCPACRGLWHPWGQGHSCSSAGNHCSDKLAPGRGGGVAPWG